MTIQRKQLQVPVEFKALATEGEFEGYASIFNNVDLGADVVLPGAFKKKDMALTKDGKVRVLYQHYWDKPIGKAEVEEDDKGLHFKASLILANSVAKDAYILMKEGVLDGMSFGFDVVPGGAEYTEGGIRQLKRLKLWEISPVTFGMNPKAGIDAVKSAGQLTTIREFEDFLRDSGFSKAQATALASKGWAGLQRRRESDDADAEQFLKFLSSLNRK
jgi:HK97 family phage prohead protease